MPKSIQPLEDKEIFTQDSHGKLNPSWTVGQKLANKPFSTKFNFICKTITEFHKFPL